MSDVPTPNQLLHQVTSSDDEIDLLEVAAALKRHKTLIAGITAGAVLLSGFYAFTRKPIWEGQFQIVLENKDSNSAGRFAQLAANNPLLANLAGLGNDNASQLETEVKVLESPSVRTHRDFVKANKPKPTEHQHLDLPQLAREELEIELAKNTSVLNISYRD